MTMGNMSDEMKKVMAKWGTEAQSETQTKEQSVQTETKKLTYRMQMYEFIKHNPQANVNKVLHHMQSNYPLMTESSVSSQLTTMFQDFMLSREQVIDPVTQRKVYGYTTVDLDIAENMRKQRKIKLAAAQARAERARQVKAERDRQRQLDREKQMNLPLETAPAPAVPETTDTGRTLHTGALSRMTAVQILQAVNFTQAKELYKELKEAFGG
jgi:hypothetical protein